MEDPEARALRRKDELSVKLAARESLTKNQLRKARKNLSKLYKSGQEDPDAAPNSDPLTTAGRETKPPMSLPSKKVKVHNVRPSIPIAPAPSASPPPEWLISKRQKLIHPHTQRHHLKFSSSDTLLAGEAEAPPTITAPTATTNTTLARVLDGKSRSVRKKDRALLLQQQQLSSAPTTTQLTPTVLPAASSADHTSYKHKPSLPSVSSASSLQPASTAVTPATTKQQVATSGGTSKAPQHQSAGTNTSVPVMDKAPATAPVNSTSTAATAALSAAQVTSSTTVHIDLSSQLRIMQREMRAAASTFPSPQPLISNPTSAHTDTQQVPASPLLKMSCTLVAEAVADSNGHVQVISMTTSVICGSLSPPQSTAAAAAAGNLTPPSSSSLIHPRPLLAHNSTHTDMDSAGKKSTKPGGWNAHTNTSSSSLPQQGVGQTGQQSAAAGGEPRGSADRNVQTGHQQQQPQKKGRKLYPHGNYHAYYSYRLGPGEQEDPRIKLLEREWLEGSRVLDIGCNEGLVTLALAQKFGCKKVMGLDIDRTLVNMASSHLATAHTAAVSALHGALQDRGLSVMDVDKEEEETAAADAAGKASAVGVDGDEALPQQLRCLKATVKTLSHTSFKCEDWAKSCTRKGSQDTILCLSVTKWVHLHHGDDGLRKLFKKFHETLTPGGHLILEPQPWRSYHSAIHKQQTSAVPYRKIEDLKLRPDMFLEYLTTTLGFVLVRDLNPQGQGGGGGEKKKSGFDRPYWVLRRS